VRYEKRLSAAARGATRRPTRSRALGDRTKCQLPRHAKGAAHGPSSRRTVPRRVAMVRSDASGDHTEKPGAAAWPQVGSRPRLAYSTFERVRAGTEIPDRFTAYEEGIRRRSAGRRPADTRSLCSSWRPGRPDPEPFVHWLMYNIPPETTNLPEGSRRSHVLTTLRRAPGGAHEDRSVTSGPAAQGRSSDHYHSRSSRSTPSCDCPGVDRKPSLRRWRARVGERRTGRTCRRGSRGICTGRE